MQYNNVTASQIQINDYVGTDHWNIDAGSEKLPNPAQVHSIDRGSRSQSGTILVFKLGRKIIKIDAAWFSSL